MKHVISILFFLSLSIAHSQTSPNGAIKFAFIENAEVVFLKDTIAVKYINQKTRKLILDTIYFNPENPIPAKKLRAGKYKMEITMKDYPEIKLTNIQVKDQRVTFLEFNLDGLIHTKKTVKLKHESPKNGYENCG